MGFLQNTRNAIRTINQKYSTPHIHMTRRVRISLGLLRGYLLFLVAIIVYRFIITARHH